MDKNYSSETLNSNDQSNEKARQSDFRNIIEKRIEEHANLQNPIYVNLGVDLGTSFTKVAWRFGETARPVRFNESTNGLEGYLVPSIVSFDGESFCAGVDLFKPNDSKTTFEIHNFKMCVACESVKENQCNISRCRLTKWNSTLFPTKINGEETLLIASFYLGKILSSAKRHIENQLFEKMGYRREPIFWSANLAVPEKLMEQSPILSSFEALFKNAYLMSYVFDELPDIKSTHEIIDCYRTAQKIALNQPLDCFVYPEVGAQVASVTMSRTTADGLYAFIDVGAGTVDGSVFRLNSDLNERKLETYAADVIRAGAANYERIASRRLAIEGTSWLRNVKESRYDLPELDSSSVREMLSTFLDEAGEEINRTVEKKLLELFVAAYSKEPFIDRWSDLQLVRGGGGSSISGYQRASNEAFSIKGKQKKPPRETNLPVPHDFNLAGLPTVDFHRFAVAYGCSFNFVDLPKIALADEVEVVRIAYKETKPVDYYAK